jgi:hypothetical protein
MAPFGCGAKDPATHLRKGPGISDFGGVSMGFIWLLLVSNVFSNILQGFLMFF